MSAAPRDAGDAGDPLRATLPAVLVGGVCGGLLRIALLRGQSLLDEEWTILVVNLLGALALGLLFERLTEHRLGRTRTWAFWGPGFLGAFTTFSAMAILAVDPLRDGAWQYAALYLIASIGLGVPLAAIGRRLGRIGA